MSAKAALAFHIRNLHLGRERTGHPLHERMRSTSTQQKIWWGSHGRRLIAMAW